MSSLDAVLIRQSLSQGSGAQLDELELFGSIDSTNTYLLAQSSPAPGRLRVAIADFQTAGRGRHYRRWVSPPGAGLCLSLAYTFDEQPDELSSLTLAIGIGVVGALQKLGIEGISLKWPNDLVALDGKLGGILTEIQPRAADGVTVVAGVGLNIDLPDDVDIGMGSEWARVAIDVRSVAERVPAREAIAAAIIDGLYEVMTEFAAVGFVGFSENWVRYDWLQGREITVDMPDGEITGIASGVDTDGALLVDTGNGFSRVVTGSIVIAGPAGTAR